jgi:hypothetical protein
MFAIACGDPSRAGQHDGVADIFETIARRRSSDGLPTHSETSDFDGNASGHCNPSMLGPDLLSAADLPTDATDRTESSFRAVPFLAGASMASEQGTRALLWMNMYSWQLAERGPDRFSTRVLFTEPMETTAYATSGVLNRVDGDWLGCSQRSCWRVSSEGTVQWRTPFVQPSLDAAYGELRALIHTPRHLDVAVRHGAGLLVPYSPDWRTHVTSSSGLPSRRLVMRLALDSGQVDRVWLTPRAFQHALYGDDYAAPNARLLRVAAILSGTHGDAEVVLSAADSPWAPQGSSWRGRLSLSFTAEPDDDPRVAEWSSLVELEIPSFTATLGEADRAPFIEHAVRHRGSLLVLTGQSPVVEGLVRVGVPVLHGLTLLGATNAVQARAAVPGYGRLAAWLNWPDLAPPASARLSHLHGDDVLVARLTHAGWEANGTRYRPELHAFDPSLRLRWSTKLPAYDFGDGGAVPVALEADACGLTLLAANAIFRISAWGHIDPGLAGACAGLGIDDCSDDDPCTLDRCDPGVGCVHVSAQQVVGCGPG